MNIVEIKYKKKKSLNERNRKNISKKIRKMWYEGLRKKRKKWKMRRKTKKNKLIDIKWDAKADFCLWEK